MLVTQLIPKIARAIYNYGKVVYMDKAGNLCIGNNNSEGRPLIDTYDFLKRCEDPVAKKILKDLDANKHPGPAEIINFVRNCDVNGNFDSVKFAIMTTEAEIKNDYALIDQSIVIPMSKIAFERRLAEDLRIVEKCGRTCWQSGAKNPNGDPNITYRFIKNLIGKHHESVLEHGHISFSLITNRNVTHQVVRHRLAAYSQESQRYCRYSGDGGVVFIRPVFFDKWSLAQKIAFLGNCENSSTLYKDLLDSGLNPQDARNVLSSSIKTRLDITYNFRELRHVLKERTSRAADPQTRALFVALLQIVPDVLKEDIIPYTDDLKDIKMPKILFEE